MDLIKQLKKRWRSLKVIRPLFWAAYRKRPTAVVRRLRADHYLDKTFPSIYKEAAKKPVNQRKALFIELRYDKLSASLQLLKDRMEEDGRFDVRVRCMNGSAKKVLQHYKDCRKLVAECATAKYIFISDGSDVTGCLPMRRETVFVETWHACGAFKRFGMSTGNMFFGASKERQMRHPAYGNVNYVTVSSPEVVWAYAEAMHLPEEVVHPVGVSRTDVFFDEERRRQAYQALWDHFPAAKGKKVILFAPTYRGHLKTATTADEFRPEVFAHSLSDEYVLVIKHHPLVQSLPEIRKDLKDQFAYDATRDMNIEDLLFTADICITDYSSIVFEYSLFLRPMLFFAYDLDEYYDWRGFYYPYEEMTPGPVCKTNEEMVEYITHMEQNFDQEEVRRFRDRFMSGCDGHATGRILEEVVKEGQRRAGVQ